MLLGKGCGSESDRLTSFWACYVKVVLLWPYSVLIAYFNLIYVVWWPLWWDQFWFITSWLRNSLNPQLQQLNKPHRIDF